MAETTRDIGSDSFIRRLLRAIAILLAIAISGCASIIKGPTSRVDIIGPADTRVIRLGDAPVEVPLAMRGDSSHYVSLPSKDEHRIVVTQGAATDTFLLRPTLNGWWIVGDIFTPLFAGVAVDAASGAWFEHDAALLYSPPNRYLDLPASWRLVRRSALVDPDTSSRRQLGITALAFLGVSSPTIQIPLLGNNVGLGIGYRVNHLMTLLASWETQGCIDLSNYRGEMRPRTHTCDLTVETIGLGTRVHIIGGVYGAAVAGWSTVAADSTVQVGRSRGESGFSTSLPTAGVGLGCSWSAVFAEYQYRFGMRRIAVAEGSSGALQFHTVRLGLNITW